MLWQSRRRVKGEELKRRSAALDRRERDIDQSLINMEPKSAAPTNVVNYNNGCTVYNDPGMMTNALATMQAKWPPFALMLRTCCLMQCFTKAR